MSIISDDIDHLENICSVYTAFSKHYFYARMLISSFVLRNNRLPLNPFSNWGYYMDDMVGRDLIVRANNNLIYLADELWTFGPIADGVLKEIELANSLNIPVFHYSVEKDMSSIMPIAKDSLVFESELLEKRLSLSILNDPDIPKENPS